MRQGYIETSIYPCYEAAAYYLPRKRAPFFALFYKTRAYTQQVLPVQTGLYQYNE